MMKQNRWIIVVSGAFILIGICFVNQSCQDDDLISDDNTTLEFKKLSEYNIYQGNPGDLTPTAEYKLYELSSQLFTDYAEKQRMIKLPPGENLTAISSGLLNFPEGTIIVKTFYYFNDKRDMSKGTKLIETRILQLQNGKWIAGTYMWNDTQTDAALISTGFNKTVNWIDQDGNGNVIAYQIPSNLECKTCHNSNKKIVPIGLKVRNLNFDVTRSGIVLNQLDYLSDEGILTPVNPGSFLAMPNYNDGTQGLSERGRAYLDINCAHCHTDEGFAERIRYRMDYETSLSASKIMEGKTAIEEMMRKGDMPKIGTTVIDKDGLELIREYLKSL